MNAVEIEEAISNLAQKPFDANEFPFAFLEAFGNKATTINRLRKGDSNKSDVGGLLQSGNIHMKVCHEGQTAETIRMLRESPATKNSRNRLKFILATDGITLEAEDLVSETAPIACEYADLPDHFSYFLPLAGISTVRQIQESAFDIRATGRLNRLYVQLLKDNPDWGTEGRSHDLNHFMARLIFCYFAEDTDIFAKKGLFTSTIETMSSPDGSNVQDIIGELFRAMNTKIDKRAPSGIARWANDFPYVNGGLFSDSLDVPQFSRIGRSYLLNIGHLDWKKINPDIFGSMIQAIADDEERGSLGMHYTSVPNIMKVLNPLFLDELREKLEDAGTNARKLLNLRNRISEILIFDPACGSGNFLVIAYKEMRDIEAQINKRRGEACRRSDVSLKNFRGIEQRDFPAEIARLALIITQYQCDVLHSGQKDAVQHLLPLDEKNWITCGNALRLDWFDLLDVEGAGVAIRASDLFDETKKQAAVSFDKKVSEIYICGNPPYLGSTWQSAEQKADLQKLFQGHCSTWKTLDYVAGWFLKAAEFTSITDSMAAFVSTNSICQGQQVPILWPVIFSLGNKIIFAHTSFKWANLAAHNAGVSVAIIGISCMAKTNRRIYSIDQNNSTEINMVENINAYLAASSNIIVQRNSKPMSVEHEMIRGNMPVDGGNLILNSVELNDLGLTKSQRNKFIRRIFGSAEFIQGKQRYCLWIENDTIEEAMKIDVIRQRIEAVRNVRLKSPDISANEMAKRAHQMREMNIGKVHSIVIPGVSSEKRAYLQVGLINNNSIITNLCYALYDAPLWNIALIASRLHLNWIATVCGKLKTDYRYSNTLGWNTFPIPVLTEKMKKDMNRCAEEILLARERHFPATIADLYDPEYMPEDLQAAHDRNDETVERIYMGRRFRNDTERLEKLFDMYKKMTIGGREGGVGGAVSRIQKESKK